MSDFQFHEAEPVFSMQIRLSLQSFERWLSDIPSKLKIDLHNSERTSLLASLDGGRLIVEEEKGIKQKSLSVEKMPSASRIDGQQTRKMLRGDAELKATVGRLLIDFNQQCLEEC